MCDGRSKQEPSNTPAPPPSASMTWPRCPPGGRPHRPLLPAAGRGSGTTFTIYDTAYVAPRRAMNTTLLAGDQNSHGRRTPMPHRNLPARSLVDGCKAHHENGVSAGW